jgi:5-methyltetrahydrofolate--homocysteine methyltransferase
MNLEHPEIVTGIHAEYVEAGSEALQTNTFGGNPCRLQHFGLAERCAEVNRRAVKLARDANPRFVIGDIGPTGEYLPPVGAGDVGRWAAGFQLQGEALIDAGVDAIHIETMSDIREAETALDAIRRLTSDLPVLVSMTFDRKRKGFFTVMGDRLIESLDRLRERGAAVVGANCSITSGEMRELAEEALGAVGGRLVFQPNAGHPTPGEVVTYDQDPKDFAADLLPVVGGGAAAVGGCCGTDPRFIQELRRLMERE